MLRSVRRQQKNRDVEFGLAIRMGNYDVSVTSTEAVFEAMRIKLNVNKKHVMTLSTIKVEWMWEKKNAKQGQRQQDGAVRKFLLVPADHEILAAPRT